MSIYGTTYSRHTRHRGSIQVSRLLRQTMIILMCTTFVTVDELRKFMEISKLQNPRTRSKTKVLPEVRPSNTVKEEDDGSVTITKVEIKPTSSGRERFGSGTKNWGKYPLDTPCLEAFSRYTSYNYIKSNNKGGLKMKHWFTLLLQIPAECGGGEQKPPGSPARGGGSFKILVRY